MKAKLPARIAATASYLPGVARTTAELVAECMPGRNAAEIEAKIGIHTRYFAPPGTTMASMGAKVLRCACERAGIAPSSLSRVLQVNSTGGDFHMPATSNALLAELGVGDEVACMDINNACVGYLNALDVGARLIATGEGPVGVVCTELGSFHIKPEDPRAYLIFGDVAMAAVLVPDDTGAGFLGAAFGNDGAMRGSVGMAHAGRTGEIETIRFGRSYGDIKKIAIGGLERSARKVFADTEGGIGDAEWVVPHQPNGAMLKMIIKHFEIDPARVVPIVQDIGSVGSASIAFGLDQLLAQRDIRQGDRVLLMGVGAGLSMGAMLYRSGPHSRALHGLVGGA